MSKQMPLPQRETGGGASTSTSLEERELEVSGMSCASCASRVERTLARQPGVRRAAVNFATGRASVEYTTGEVTLEELRAAVDRIGYGVAPVEFSEEQRAEAADSEQRYWLVRVLVAWPLGLVVMALLVFRMDAGWARWSAALLSVPVQFWAGWPFLR